MSNIVGPLIGASIDRKDGGSGVKGAFIGSLAQSVVRAAISAAVTFAAGYALKKIFEKSADQTPQDA